MVNPMEKMAEADTKKICQERKRKGKTSTENKHKFARRKARAPSCCPISYIKWKKKNAKSSSRNNNNNGSQSIDLSWKHKSPFPSLEKSGCHSCEAANKGAIFKDKSKQAMLFKWLLLTIQFFSARRQSLDPIQKCPETLFLGLRCLKFTITVWQER